MAKKTTKKKSTPKKVTALTHEDASRKNIPTAEYQSVMGKEQQAPVPVAYSREGVGGALADEKAGRNRDLDPQLVWRGKDEQDWSDLVVHAPPLFIQEKVHPKVLIDDLRQRTEAGEHDAEPQLASTSTRPTASSSTRTFSGQRQPEPLLMARQTTSPGSLNRLKRFGIHGGTGSIHT